MLAVSDGLAGPALIRLVGLAALAGWSASLALLRLPSAIDRLYAVALLIGAAGISGAAGLTVMAALLAVS